LPSFSIVRYGLRAGSEIVFFAFDLLDLDGQDPRRTPLIERRAALRKLIKPDPRSPIQSSDHLEVTAPGSLRPPPNSGWRA